MKTKAVVAGIVTPLIAIGLAGCSPKASDDTSGTDSGSGDEQVTVTYSNFISNGGNEDNLQKIVDAFEDANPTITVDVSTTDYDDYFTKLQTDLSAGTQADVFDVDVGSYPNIQADGVLAPLEGVDDSAYREQVLDTYNTDGQQFGLPTSFSDVVLFYNKDLFDEAGIDYPTDDWTWADEKAAAEKLTDTDAGVWGDYQPISYNEYYKVVQQAGGEFLSSDGSEAAFDTDAGKDAASWLTDKAGTVMPTKADGAGTPDFDSNLFKDGDLAMWHTGIWMFSLLGDLDFDWDVAVEPGDTQKASATFSNAVVVSKDAKNAEAAQKWAEFLSSSEEMVQVRLDAGWELPAISDESQLEPYLSKGTPENRQAVFDALDHIATAPQLGANSNEIQDAINDALGEVAAGRSDVDTAIPDLSDKVSSLLQ